MWPTGILKCKAHTLEDHKADSRDTNISNVNILEYFRSNANIEADKEASRLITQRIHYEFINVFTGIGSFEGTFKLKVKEDSCPYQALPRWVTYALQQPVKGELNRWQEQKITVTLDVDEIFEGWNSFVLVSKHNGKVWLCLDPVSLKKVLIRLVHRGPTLNDILHRLVGVKVPNTHWCKLRLSQSETRWTIFIFNYLFLSGRYRCITPASDMFKIKIDKLFQELPNILVLPIFWLQAWMS